MTSAPPPLPRRAYLGFEVEAVAGRPGASREGWIASEVDEGSPAQLGGLKCGDEIFALDGIEVRDLAELRERAGARRAGDSARLLILRDGDELELELVSREMPLEPLADGHVELDEVQWSSPEGPARLRAMWTVPAVEPWAALWLLPSATWVSQENPLSTWDPSYHLVNQLTSAGIATLRVDRSGLGDSEGPPCTTMDFEAEMSMWRAARDYFLAHERAVGPRFLFGRSLGGMMAPLLAVESSFSGVVVWGSASEPWHAASQTSFEEQLRQAGKAGQQWEESARRIERLLELVYVQGLTPAQARLRAPELCGTLAEEYCGELVHDRVASFFQQLNRAKVAEAWQRLECPVLAVHAEYDILTREAQLRRICQVVGEHAELVLLPGVDHFMHRRKSMEEAVAVPWGGSFDPVVTEMLLDFFRRTIG